MRILFIGDIHGDIRSTWEMLDAARRELRIGAAVQVGDFGFFPEILGNLPDDFPRFPVPLYAIDGNHEDHAWLAACRENRTVEEMEATLDLHYMERGSVTVIGGTRFGFLAGPCTLTDRRSSTPQADLPTTFNRTTLRARLNDSGTRGRTWSSRTSCPTGIGIESTAARSSFPGC